MKNLKILLVIVVLFGLLLTQNSFCKLTKTDVEKIDSKTYKYKPTEKEGEEKLETRTIIVGKGFLEIYTNKGIGGTFGDGEEIGIYFRSSVSGYITLIDINYAGEYEILLPTRSSGNFIHANRRYSLKDFYSSPTYVNSTGDIEYLVAFVTSFHLYKEVREISMKMSPNATFDMINQFLAKNSKSVKSVGTTHFFIETQRFANIIFTAKKGAFQVFLDNVDYGYAPLEITGIPLGMHFLKVLQGGKEIYSDYINIIREGTITYNLDDMTSIKENIIVDEIFPMQSVKHKFEREIDSKIKLVIESRWKLGDLISTIDGTIEIKGDMDIDIVSIDTHFDEVPYKGQKYVKHVNDYTFTVQVLDFEIEDEEFKWIKFRIMVEKQ